MAAALDVGLIKRIARFSAARRKRMMPLIILPELAEVEDLQLGMAARGEQKHQQGRSQPRG